jgi:hypothetical protein
MDFEQKITKGAKNVFRVGTALRAVRTDAWDRRPYLCAATKWC